MSQAYVYEEGGKACAEEGQVMLDGLDGVAVSMTPKAAEGMHPVKAAHNFTASRMVVL